MDHVKNVLTVLSGKGGVGKSTVACQLAMGLAAAGKTVGILDIDLCGPSVPKILGVEGKDVTNGEKGWIPVDGPHGLKVMSIQFLLEEEGAAVVWRGPKKDSVIKQFLNNVDWGDCDLLVVDTPPGTSDEHLTLCEQLKGRPNVGAVVVTGPQKVACDDVRKEMSFCQKLNLPVIGIVENMSGFACPHCSTCTPVFSSGGGKLVAGEYNVAFLGQIPIDPNLSRCEDSGMHFAEAFPNSQTAVAISSVVTQIQGKL
eukprot:TRINITY_DN32090_c0_g1_i1.p2 TRINITY_DN32090_c0_g1~~TRINITY_DN32090_c0_g1_i1.p2  ORF type:complete len:256 (+),score=118.12 TRINITY_DN32090_c0_g1_i1:36-803(+)